MEKNQKSSLLFTVIPHLRDWNKLRKRWVFIFCLPVLWLFCHFRNVNWVEKRAESGNSGQKRGSVVDDHLAESSPSTPSWLTLPVIFPDFWLGLTAVHTYDVSRQSESEPRGCCIVRQLEQWVVWRSGCPWCRWRGTCTCRTPWTDRWPHWLPTATT